MKEESIYAFDENDNLVEINQEEGGKSK